MDEGVLMNRKTAARHEPLYGVENGEMVYLDADPPKRVATFVARIVEERKLSSGVTEFVIEGETREGTTFRATIDSYDYSYPQRLREVLSGAVGAGGWVHQGMKKHLPQAIKSLTAQSG